jgi:hypothetical protein
VSRHTEQFVVSGRTAVFGLALDFAALLMITAILTAIAARLYARIAC